VRAGPSNTSPIVGKVVQDQALTVHENRLGWLRIDLPGGGSGWVYNRYLTPPASTTNPFPYQIILNPRVEGWAKTVGLQ